MITLIRQFFSCKPYSWAPAVDMTNPRITAFLLAFDRS